jgi:YVTN family beta-propeller protein
MAQEDREDGLPCESSANIINSSKYHNNFDYNHTFELGINLTYPSDWKVIDEKATYFQLAPLAEGESSDVILTTTSLPSGNKRLEEFVGIDVNDFKQNNTYFTNFNLIESKRTTVADKLAYKLVFSHEGPQFPVNSMLIYTISGNKVYIIYYQASPDKYCEYLPTVEKMIDSMKIHGIEAVVMMGQSGIKLDDSPIDLAINPQTNKLYVVASDADKIYVIDGSTKKVISNITVGSIPNAISINSITNTIYVASQEADKIYVIDGSTNNVIFNITAGPAVADIAIDNNEFGGSGSLIYVTNSGSNTVSVIDGATNKNISEPIEVGNSPFGVTVDPITNKLYVANILDNTISVIDYVTYVDHTYIARVIDNVTVGIFPTAVAADSNSGRVYVTNSGNNTVSVIDGATNKVVGNIIVNLFPASLAINTNNSKIYTAYVSNNRVSVIDVSSSKDILKYNITNINVDSPSSDIAINPNTNMIYVANHDSKTVSVINGTKDNRIVGVTFNINPPNAGYIECNDDNIISNNRHITYMIDSSLECEAKSNSAFIFNSWSGDLAPISNTNAKTPSTVSDRLFGSWFDGSQANSKMPLTISKYGTLSANFISPVEVSIPTELLLGIILSPIIGWSIPFIADRYTRNKQTKRLGKYMIEHINSELDKPYENKEEYLKGLNDLRNKIQDIYVDGKINESQFKIINKRIREYEEKVDKS